MRAALSAASPLPLDMATSPLSPRALAFALTLAGLVGVIASLGTALRASSVDPLIALRGRTDDGRGRRRPYRSALVVAQVALSMALLAAAGLLFGSLRAANRLSPGFDAHRTIVASLDAARAGYDAPRALLLQRQLAEGIQAVPGVTAVAIGTSLPFVRTMSTTTRVGGRSERVNLEAVTSNYGSALGLALVRGRDLVASDDSGTSAAALINEAAAARLWPNEDPIGQRLDDISPRRLAVEIVGVVKARTGGPRDPAMPLVLVPRASIRCTSCARIDVLAGVPFAGVPFTLVGSSPLSANAARGRDRP